MNYIVSVTTTKPSTSVTPGGGGGSLTLLDPNTGAILSSLRSSADISGKTGMGIASLSCFPSDFFVPNGGPNMGDSTQPVIAYGGNSMKRGDNYGMLISIRSASSPPIMHWKCRLPETDMSAGMSISPCGNYIAGGGSSGCCYIWSSIGGELLRSLKAHYRSCTSLTWSDCGRYLVTGGADGMIHLFSLMDLVDVVSNTSKSSKRNVPPIHTFSVHHFPVTSLMQLSGGRVASSAEDGQVLVLELFSKQVLVNIQFPHGILCMEHFDGRLYAGSSNGIIYSVDLNAYAMHQTEKLGAIFANKRRRQSHFESGSSKNWTLAEKVFGTNKSEKSSIDGETGSGYQTDWIGHDHSVTSIALLSTSVPQKMISGDSFGQIRIWDIESRTCLSVIQPWSSGNAIDSDQKKSMPIHPVTSIQVICQPERPPSSRIFQSTSSSNKKYMNISTLVTPLQKYTSDSNETASYSTNAPTIASGTIRVPFLKNNRVSSHLKFMEPRVIQRTKRKQSFISHDTLSNKTDETDRERIEKMEAIIEDHLKQLESKDSEIKRWKAVNNKLMARLRDN